MFTTCCADLVLQKFYILLLCQRKINYLFLHRKHSLVFFSTCLVIFRSNLFILQLNIKLNDSSRSYIVGHWLPIYLFFTDNMYLIIYKFIVFFAGFGCAVPMATVWQLLLRGEARVGRCRRAGMARSHPGAQPARCTLPGRTDARDTAALALRGGHQHQEGMLHWKSNINEKGRYSVVRFIYVNSSQRALKVFLTNMFGNVVYKVLLRKVLT